MFNCVLNTFMELFHAESIKQSFFISNPMKTCCIFENRTAIKRWWKHFPTKYYPTIAKYTISYKLLIVDSVVPLEVKSLSQNFIEIQNQSPWDVVKKLFLKTLLKAVTLLKMRLRQRCFPVNFAKFLRTSILQNNCEWLLLKLKFQKAPRLSQPFADVN